MDLCGRPGATGPEVRESLIAHGWTEVVPEGRRALLRSLVSAHMWSFMPDDDAPAREAAFDRVLRSALMATNAGNGSLLVGGDAQKALIVWEGLSISCLWEGLQNKATVQLADAIGGFSPSDGMSTVSQRQIVEGQAGRWSQWTAFARIPSEDLPLVATDAARLDRVIETEE